MSRFTHLRVFAFAGFFALLNMYGCFGGHKIYYEPDYTERFYVPKPIPVKSEMLSEPVSYPCKEVTLINNHTPSAEVSLSPCDQTFEQIGAYTHKWRANLRLWTETSLGVSRTELIRRGVKVTDNAPKVLKLSLNRACLRWAFRDVGCFVDLKVETGDGYVAHFEIDNRSIDIHDSCDGAITRAVAAMFNDTEIRAYLTCPPPPSPPPAAAPPVKSAPLDSDGDGVTDDKDRCPGTPKGAKVDEWGCWILPDIQFEFDQHDILPKYRPTLDHVAEVMKMNPGLRMILGGHTCTMGSEKYNVRLSEYRAEAVKRYLVERGADPMNILSKWYYYSRPKASNDTEEGRSLNRRTELQPVLPLQGK